MHMIILGIETSCDETAAAVVVDGREELASSLATSEELHQSTGGVVPEVAARKQLEFFVPVLEDVCIKAAPKLGLSNYTEVLNKVDAIAVTVGPGLIGSLLVGVNGAKALAFAHNKPLVPVNHLVGHIYGNFLRPLQHSDSNSSDHIAPATYLDNFSNEENIFPALVLIVSGGHTDLVLMKGHGSLEYLGGTVDDAAGEAFDKVARMLGLSSYLGGPLISKAAAECRHNSLLGQLPRPKIADEDYDFSFSGLKTATKNLINSYSSKDSPLPLNEICCEFEIAVVDVLIAKTKKAAQANNIKSILLGGGVSANKQLRTRLLGLGQELGVFVSVPPIRLCTDNAIYIASAAYYNYRPVSADKLDLIKANPGLGIVDQ
ncbi:tRNA (adenosine(37)-N6)-threonylcarbamoyltransferase complex transferase subunit TsaD [Candidatus Nomurabacteria bacterium]|uniref:tRNA N6-adenosine threonylcarbamoyltransferase n=1 Tax=candidate division WWE3 bacterium TaxID=2053526 RepID=A0A955E0S4_UNCKA|nr:tRNA (adenosine(37)-N6)-threonylcarbamoyltransferase complex transferase subunit TsaD [candidate division WWE3 bacterium]MCB9823427.1 tRNA (adenosine(37)-N6)-threonylcarbamoyltransferase complex transferase subunit TsaD [Candidatus Nomurabacteria bacterium]MCB9827709.1 tRNA (adenosine(37)-N6)-threonylcarbamoyltransferase complex transferase subunit TsaD [Candidatus Nomurabacteria bacterium]